MSFTPLTDPFTIRFRTDDKDYEALVTYARDVDCCTNFFDVVIKSPSGIEPFQLKEKPAPGAEFESMIWVDKQDQVKMLYQFIGDGIERYMKENLRIFLIDAPVHKNEDDFYEGQEN